MSNVPFFQAEKIAEGSWQISYAFTDREHVYCYLVEGDKTAAVIDTMYGYGNLREFCSSLTDKPLVLLNTHYHIDHVSGNHDFDSCYMHYDDIALYNDSSLRSREEKLKTAREEAYEQYREQITIEDMCDYKHMPVYPLYDHELLNLGGRKLEVILAGGHTPGSVVFLDWKSRIAYTGDACNSNTLLGFPSSLSVETYLGYLLNLRHYICDFDMMYGGHQVLKPEVIDEGIELCGRVLAGTDDKEERAMMGRMNLYGASHQGRGRADGKTFNIWYNPEKIYKKEEEEKIIDFSAKAGI